MPPRERISRAVVVEAATGIVEREGLAALTARRVASELETSIAPVYRQFESMEALAAAVVERGRDLLLASAAERHTERPFLDMGVGIALFARDHPRLYHALFLETDAFAPVVQGLLDQLTDDMRRDARFAAMPRGRRAELLESMWTYTHGLASLLAVGLARDTSTEGIVRSLDAVGTAVILHTLAPRELPPEACAPPTRAPAPSPAPSPRRGAGTRGARTPAGSPRSRGR